MKQESIRKRYRLQQALYTPDWVRQEVQENAIDANQARMTFSEEDEIYIKIIDKFMENCPEDSNTTCLVRLSLS